jgi:threonine dehydrogenase-like Zn-dependent dehydrogenase
MASVRVDQRSQRSNQYPVPKTMKAWVLGNPEELALVEKPVPEPGPAEVLVRVDAIAVCATDIEIIRHGVPAMIDGELPFNKNFTPGHEYMGTVVRLGPSVDEFQIGDRVQLNCNARPNYLHGAPATVTGLNRQHVNVKLDQPIGRFHTGQLRCPPLILNKLAAKRPE